MDDKGKRPLDDQGKSRSDDKGKKPMVNDGTKPMVDEVPWAHNADQACKRAKTQEIFDARLPESIDRESWEPETMTRRRALWISYM